MRQRTSLRLLDIINASMQWCEVAAAHVEVPKSITDAVDRLNAIQGSLDDSLITIGFVGPFSSGKTLLISSLLNQLTATLDPEDDSRTPDIGGEPASHVCCLATVFAHLECWRCADT